jgi:hypothetical protein
VAADPLRASAETKYADCSIAQTLPDAGVEPNDEWPSQQSLIAWMMTSLRCGGQFCHNNWTFVVLMLFLCSAREANEFSRKGRRVDVAP